jgi:hypothetical protein
MAEMEPDIVFLLLRSCSAGSVSFSSDRWPDRGADEVRARARA